MDEHQFRELFAGTFDDVWRFARRRTGSSEQADDVAADVFAVAWRRRQELPAHQARLWLFGVTRNVLSTQRREAARRHRLHWRVASHDARPESHDPLETSGSGRSQQVWVALAALGEADREVLLMRAWDDLPVADIAVVLGVTAAVVSSRLGKARARLARELDRRDPDAPGHVVGAPRTTPRTTASSERSRS